MFIRYNEALDFWEYDTSAGQTGAGPWLKLPVDAGQLNGVLPPVSLPSNIAYKDQSNIFTVNQSIASGGLILGPVSAVGHLILGITGGIAIVNGINTAYDDIRYSRAFERGRATALGEWIDVPYDAANFTTSGAMTWSVPSGSVVVYTYTLIGKSMILTFQLNTTVIGGTVDSYLKVKIPGGFLPARSFECVGFAIEPGVPSYVTTRIRVFLGDPFLYNLRLTSNNWVASAGTHLMGQLVIPIQ